MLFKRVNNLCAQDKKRKEYVPSRVLYILYIFFFLFNFENKMD